MSTSRFDSRPGTRSSEIIFIGKSPWKPCARFLLLALAAGAVTYAFAASQEFLNWLRVEREAGAWAAALSGGVATIMFVCAAWTWTSRLRWVAVSPEGLRWLRGPRAKYVRWDQYIGVHRGSIEISVWGEDLRAGRYADIEFRSSRPLRISTYTINGYDDLIAEVQMTSSQAMRNFCAFGGSRSGLDPTEGVAYGPLRLRHDGLVWSGTLFRWDEIEDYEVSVGYLRVQPVKGSEFLRRLSELGDPTLVLDQLEQHVALRRASQSQTEPAAVAS